MIYASPCIRQAQPGLRGRIRTAMNARVASDSPPAPSGRPTLVLLPDYQRRPRRRVLDFLVICGLLLGALLFLCLGYFVGLFTVALTVMWWAGVEGTPELLVLAGALLVGTLHGCRWCWECVGAGR
ncbi:MAG: hypothetical protein QOE70_2125 [Chthoniobacter sp.]|jgi:hypothetical protein|nr:hypothetical protein [Chthoniobacter sp.]